MNKEELTKFGWAIHEAIAEIEEFWLHHSDIPKVDEYLELTEKKTLELVGKICSSVGHDWTLDQCGMEEHAYCSTCAEAKYPLLAGKSCNEINKLLKEDRPAYDELFAAQRSH